MPLDFLSDSRWQMTLGERAALVGILAELRPRLAIEIGTAEGGSLRRVARHGDRVHSIDLVPPEPALRELGNVSFHTGDGHVLLPRLLGELAERGESVDFVLVDGDHSADGVERDMRDLLASDAVRQAVIVAHDTLNDEVRRGLERLDYAAEPKVVHADLDFVGGHLSEAGEFARELWGGLGLFLLDAGRAPAGEAAAGSGFYDLFELLAPVRDALRARGGSPRAAVESAERELQAVKRSPSWRLTAPLRAAKRAAGSRRPRR